MAESIYQFLAADHDRLDGLLDRATTVSGVWIAAWSGLYRYDGYSLKAGWTSLYRIGEVSTAD